MTNKWKKMQQEMTHFVNRVLNYSKNYYGLCSLYIYNVNSRHVRLFSFGRSYSYWKIVCSVSTSQPLTPPRVFHSSQDVSKRIKVQNIWDLTFHKRKCQEDLGKGGQKKYNVRNWSVFVCLIPYKPKNSTTGFDGCQEEKKQDKHRGKKKKI